ncbi:hypothetical protein BDM02DRAFT_1246970 [Thelephora ganbajun]|uniref:Uncharacterized protein n=1 Tax=Thelephora ganbajun TaxID=370292 RepID=A0ACB6Z3B5_THEGA|nr:hypothetical protein BDM02DRAFT_1246970 [Thelephora ganbajun]
MPISPDENSNAPIPDLPEHWDFSGETHPVLFIHQMFCYIGSGCATLQTVWERSHTSAWGTLRRDVADRTQHINIVAGLLLTTIATFCTTQPPENSRLLPYTKTVPYCFLMVAMHLTIGGLIIGSTAVFIIHKASPVWFREVCVSPSAITRCEKCDVGIGYNGFKVSHLDHDDRPLRPLHNCRNVDVVLHTRFGDRKFVFGGPVC